MSQTELESLRRWFGVPYGEWDTGTMKRFLLGQPFYRRDHDYYGRLSAGLDEAHLVDDVVWIWRRLENLGGIFEETVREWFLPTYMACQLTPDLRYPVTTPG